MPALPLSASATATERSSPVEYSRPSCVWAAEAPDSLMLAMLMWAAQIGVTVGARVASPRHVSLASVAAGLAMGLVAAIFTFGLTIHGCDEGAPRFGWVLSSVLIALAIAGVERRAWRVGLALVHLGAGLGVTVLLTDAVHGPLWSGRPDRGSPEWHTPLTGLYRRFHPERALTSALVDRMTAAASSDPCEAAAIRALAARAEPDEAEWQAPPIDGEPCSAPTGPPQTSEQAFAELLTSATEIAAIERHGDFWAEIIFLGDVTEKARWLDPADACALVAALPADTATWSRGIAVDAVGHNITPEARAACRDEIRAALLGPGDVGERLFLPEVYDPGERRAALATFAASDRRSHARVETLAASRRYAGALGEEVDREILALIDREPDPAMRRSLAATALEALQP